MKHPREGSLHHCLPLFATLLSLFAVQAYAEIVGADGSSRSRAVVGTASTVSVDWRVQTVSTSADRSLAIISSEAFITLEGDTADMSAVRVPQPLKRLLPPATPPAPRTAAFRETIVVPAQIVDAALATGLRIFVVRTFRDQETLTPVQAMAQIRLGGGNTAPLNVSRIVLRFPDGASDKIMARNARSHVLAEISYTGAGRLRAIWEIAEPASIAGEPMYRALSTVHRTLVRGARNLVLRSPTLPSGMEGLHLLRLRLLEPEAAGAPAIRYAINSALRTAPEPVRLIVHSPAPGAIHTAQTSFHWSPAQDAAVYQIELFTRSATTVADTLPELGSLAADDRSVEQVLTDERYPDAGIMVSAISTHASLSRLTLSQLVAGRTYDWRVIAYDAQGRLVGASALRPLTIPD